MLLHARFFFARSFSGRELNSAHCRCHKVESADKETKILAERAEAAADNEMKILADRAEAAAAELLAEEEAEQTKKSSKKKKKKASTENAAARRAAAETFICET